MFNKKNKILLLIDKYTNLFYTYVEDNFYNNKFFITINKYISKFSFIYNKVYNLKFKYKNIIKQFDKNLFKIIKHFNIEKSIDIIMNRIHYQSVLEKNKLIIKISNFKNIIIYIPHIHSIHINISYENNLINLASKNIDYITNLASLIKNIKKIDRCTGVGMHYANEKIMFKRKIINDIKKK